MMGDWQYFMKVAGVIFGASGVWKVVELYFKARSDKRLKAAETKNLHVQAEGAIVRNWIQWSQHLESRVLELEAVAEENRKLTLMVNTQTDMIEAQRARISELESKVKSLEKENAALKRQITGLTGKK